MHVMPMWEPSPQQSAVPADTTVAERRRTRLPKKAPEAAARSFADPFADDDGANCIRCGYLIEQAREKCGLMTCSKCG
ncbi:hypothetical protein ACFQU2_17685 [Siccirubricoccus deserti]